LEGRERREDGDAVAEHDAPADEPLRHDERAETSGP
jgi:hypothetical protein